jgi:hypothetical protein
MPSWWPWSKCDAVAPSTVARNTEQIDVIKQRQKQLEERVAVIEARVAAIRNTDAEDGS